MSVMHCALITLSQLSSSDSGLHQLDSSQTCHLLQCLSGTMGREPRKFR